jgi:phospholipid/cholesterol/gamma-HCH transport system permease protein
MVSTHDFLTGIYLDYSNYDVVYALVKTIVFAFLITTISGYYGYYTEGGALEVGRSSTKAVVNSSIMIIIANLVLTQILLI